MRVRNSGGSSVELRVLKSSAFKFPTRGVVELFSSEVSAAGSKKRIRDGTKNRGSSGEDSALAGSGTETGDFFCAGGGRSAGCEVSVWSGSVLRLRMNFLTADFSRVGGAG